MIHPNPHSRFAKPPCEEAARQNGEVPPAARNHMLRGMRDIETIDGELVAALRRAARERGGPLPRLTWRMRCWMNALS
jgi:hypothetical protein